MTESPDPLDFWTSITSPTRSAHPRHRSGWVRERVLPGIETWFEAGEFPLEVAKELGAMGLLGMHLTGTGAPARTRELRPRVPGARGRGQRLPSFVSVQGSLCMFPIWKFGSEEQKERWLPAMARGEVIGCFGLTEPDVGRSDSRPHAHARATGTTGSCRGRRCGSPTAAWPTSRSCGPAPTTGSAGSSSRPRHRVLGERRASQALAARERDLELVLDEVRLPADGAPGVTGLKGPLSCPPGGAVRHRVGFDGRGALCFESALEYATTRVQWGKPIGGFQLTQRKLADMAVELNKDAARCTSDA